MFQITIINKKQAKLIDEPIELKTILNNLGIDKFIDPAIIPDIQEFYPNVLISKLSMKPEVNRYEIKPNIKHLLDLCKSKSLSKKDEQMLKDVEAIIRKTGGIGKRYYYHICRLAKK